FTQGTVRRGPLGGTVEFHGLAEQRLLAAEGGIEARPVDTHRRREIAERRPFVAALPKDLHRPPQRRGSVERARAASPAHRRSFLYRPENKSLDRSSQAGYGLCTDRYIKGDRDA